MESKPENNQPENTILNISYIFKINKIFF